MQYALSKMLKALRSSKVKLRKKCHGFQWRAVNKKIKFDKSFFTQFQNILLLLIVNGFTPLTDTSIILSQPRLIGKKEELTVKAKVEILPVQDCYRPA